MSTIPMNERTGLIWYNGKIIDWQDANIHMLNHGLHYGSCVFEGIRVYNTKIFKLEEHTKRFIRSGELLGFNWRYTYEELLEATKEIVKKQEIINGYIRPFAWRGYEKLTIGAPSTSIHTAIACWNLPDNYFENKENGLKLVTAKWKRPFGDVVPYESKASGLYVTSTLAKHEAMADGFDDGLMLDSRGYVAESTAANIFFVINNELHTPIADCFLNGITRQTVIEVAKANNIKVVERHILPNELQNATEVFLTGTAAEITPVVQIDDIKFEKGNITKLIHEKYRELTK